MRGGQETSKLCPALIFDRANVNAYYFVAEYVDNYNISNNEDKGQTSKVQRDKFARLRSIFATIVRW